MVLDKVIKAGLRPCVDMWGKIQILCYWNLYPSIILEWNGTTIPNPPARDFRNSLLPFSNTNQHGRPQVGHKITIGLQVPSSGNGGPKTLGSFKFQTNLSIAALLIVAIEWTPNPPQESVEQMGLQGTVAILCFNTFPVQIKVVQSRVKKLDEGGWPLVNYEAVSKHAKSNKLY